MQRDTENKSIAIVGIDCRFPQSDNINAYWRLLKNGVDAITEVPIDRWDMNALYDAMPGTVGKICSRFGGFINDVDKFDAEFFGISDREAISMDPQQRLLLEMCWHGFEDAGIDLSQLAGSRTGVIIGAGAYDYNKILNKDFSLLNGYVGPGTTINTLANRISYLFDLRGPSFTIDTACSSSLVAAHMACQSLKQHECDLMLVGSINLMLTPESSITFSQAGMLADRCKTFDSSANGYVRAEGGAVIILKRYADALKNNDHIYGLIRGSAVNQDGLSNGITAPNGLAQQAVIREALVNANTSISDISYIETHGTGTRLGDPIEVNALKKVLSESEDEEQACVLGAVKTNIGHLEAAAGIAGLIKIILAMRHKMIPANLHLTKINPQIQSLVKDSAIVLPTENIPWVTRGKPRIAGISSFGFGGTNSHMIIEEPENVVQNKKNISTHQYIFTLSAKNDIALRKLIQQYYEYLKNNQQNDLFDICFSVNTGRVKFNYRFSTVVTSIEQLEDALKAYIDNSTFKHVLCGKVNQLQLSDLTLVFSRIDLSDKKCIRDFCTSQPIIKKFIDQCDVIIKQQLNLSVLSILWGDDAHLLKIEQYDQLMQFTLQYAMAQTLFMLGVRFARVISHTNKLIAACMANIIHINDALELLSLGCQYRGNTNNQAKLAELYREKINGMKLYQPALSIIDEYTEETIEQQLIHKDYWQDYFIQPKNKSKVTSELLFSPDKHYLHIGNIDCPDNLGMVAGFDWSYLLRTLGELYCQGSSINWNKFYHGLSGNKVQLPTYPFQERRYWVDDHIHQLQIQSASGVIKTSNDDKKSELVNEQNAIYDIIFQLKWKEIELVGDSDQQFIQKNIVVLFSGQKNKLFDVIESAHYNGQVNAIEITSAINLHQHEGQLQQADTIYFLTEEVVSMAITNLSVIQSYQSVGVFVFLELIKIISSCDNQKKININIFTYNLLSLNDKAGVPHYASLIGLARVAANENQQLKIAHFDLDDATKNDESMLVNCINHALEFIVKGGVALRQGKYFQQVIESSLSSEKNCVIYKPNGIYIITGGLGGIGFSLSWYLAQKYQARLILIGRSNLSNEKKQLIRLLKSVGSEVEYIISDLQDIESLEFSIAQAKSQFGKINGIFHLAATLNDKSLVDMTESDFHSVFASKIYGTANLAHVFSKEPLDFFITFSSFSSIVGVPGQGNYASASVFQDAFSHAFNQQTSYPVKVINWGYWGDIGIGGDELTNQKMQALGMKSISIKEGMHVLEYVLANDDVQTVIVKADDTLKLKLGIDNLATDVATEDLVCDLSNQKAIEQLLLNIINEITLLKHNEIQSGSVWTELGIDSIVSMQILAKIELYTGVRLFPNELLEHNTFKKLAMFVFSECNEGRDKNLIPNQWHYTTKNSCKGIEEESAEVKPIIYLLSAPRSGSTLMRVMLMGHSALFAPPELHLLPYDSLAVRKKKMKESGRYYFSEGLIETMSALEGESIDDAKIKIEQWEADEKSVKDVYKYLQHHSQGRYVIDKSPGYGMDIETLLRAEEITPNAYYIYLTRHPIAMMESYVRNRFDKLLGDNQDPWKSAEQVWYTSNYNINEFLQAIPFERKCIVNYESLVQEPKSVMKSVCHMLDIDFEQAMLNPYEGNRLTHGLHKESISIGDPNFLNHQSIDRSLANSWEKHEGKISSLTKNTTSLASKLNYSLLEKKYKLMPNQQAFCKRRDDDFTWNLVYQLDFIEDNIDIERYKLSLNKVLCQHLGFRLSFIRRNKQWEVNERTYQNIDFSLIDLTSFSETEVTYKKLKVIAELNQSISLVDNQVIQCAIIKTAKNIYTLTMVIHHFICDGASLIQIVNQLFDLYRNDSFPSKDDELYQHYLVQLNSINEQQYLAKYQTSWLKHIQNSTKLFFTDYSNGSNTIDSEKNICKFILSDDFYFNDKNHLERYGLLVVALYKTLSIWNKDHQPVVAHRLHRRHIKGTKGYENLIGNLAGDTPLKLIIGENDSMYCQWQSWLELVSDGAISYELLSNIGELPILHVITPCRINYQPMPPLKNVNAINQEIKIFQSHGFQREYILDFIIRDYNNRIDIMIRYSSHLHKAETIQALLDDWLNNFEEIH